jgi:hypothetical protein
LIFVESQLRWLVNEAALAFLDSVGWKNVTEGAWLVFDGGKFVFTS